MRTIVVAWLAAAFALPAVAAPCELTARDRAEIKAVIERYRASWLAGDEPGVMATFTESPVAAPPNMGQPLLGRKALTDFWWPAGGTPTTITRLDITVEDMQGDCRFAWARGQDSVEWVAQGSDPSKPRGNSGTYVNVMQRSSSGWKIAVHMWNDDPRLRH